MATYLAGVEDKLGSSCRALSENHQVLREGLHITKQNDFNFSLSLFSPYLQFYSHVMSGSLSRLFNMWMPFSLTASRRFFGSVLV